MSYLYGPYTPATGVLTSQSVDQTAVAIRVTNDSPNDLWIDFGPSRPAVPNPLVSAAAFDAVVQAWSSQVLIIPGPYPNNSWAGLVWLLPVAGGGLAASGTTSSRGNVYLTTYQQGEDPGTNHAVSRQADATSQSRVISIPTEPHLAGDYGILLTAAGTIDTGLRLATGQVFSGNQLVTVYTYGLLFGMKGLHSADVELVVTELNGVGAITNFRTTGIRLFAVAEHGTYAVPQASGAAIPIRFTPAATTVAIGYGISMQSLWPSSLLGSPNQPEIFGSIYGDIDLTGQIPPPAIGNGAATPAGAIY